MEHGLSGYDTIGQETVGCDTVGYETAASAAMKKCMRIFFALREEISFAYLFGPYAEGWVKPGESICIAVWLSSAVPSRRYFLYNLILSYELKALLGTTNIRLVVLNQALPAVKKRILERGIPIFSRHTLDHFSFMVEANGGKESSGHKIKAAGDKIGDLFRYRSRSKSTGNLIDMTRWFQ